jgi:carbon monoxide dehydrogenase subunit G
MTVRVKRTLELAAPPEEVWAFISDAEKRARPISVVADFELLNDREAVWHVELPIPYVDATVAIETEETDRDPPEFVRFVGTSKVMRVVGEHELTPNEGGTRLVNRFVVEGRVPGVEKHFRSNLDEELDNLEAAIREELGL